MSDENKQANDSAREDLQTFIAIRRVRVKLRATMPRLVRDSTPTPPVVSLVDDGQWVVHMLRLYEIEDALARGEPIDARMYEELRALVAVVGYECEARFAKRPGRKEDPQLFRRAAVVLALHDSHGIKLEAAVNAVSIETGTEDRRRKDRQNVKRAYSKLASKGGTVRVPESEVLAALDRLGESQKSK